MRSYAEFGSHILAAQAQAEGRRQAAAHVAANVGYTTPATLKDRIRALDASATSLDSNIRINVADPAFKSAWTEWLTNFRAWRDKWLSAWNVAALGTVMNSEVEQEIVDRQTDLEGWYQRYSQQVGPSGQPVPGPSAGPPSFPQPGQGGSSGPWYASLSLPWWAWLLGGVGLVGLCYSGVRIYRKTRDDEKMLRQLTYEKLLPGMMGGERDAAANARVVYVQAPTTMPAPGPIVPPP